MTAVDRRVVDMEFNNRQFETGVQQSVKSLDNLKNGLKLEGASKGLLNVSSAAKGFNLQGISDAAQNISSKFSVMGAIGFTVLQNLTTSAMGLTEKLIKAAFGIDQMQTGFGSYETKINATKTVMAGTGETIEEVTKSLDELNTYSDRTVYSFEDMTSNISKFTNAGLKSKDAAIAIQGISNVAAISGANAQEAARAMYNFGQAMQQGSVRLMDWKSIENANMATIGFKQQLIDTAVAMGMLKKATDGTYKTLSGEVLSATANFNGSLEKQWLTTEVLTKTLADYASQTTEIGKKANAAATEVTTFSQLMSVFADSVKTGWTKSWGIIFGDLNESKALFTEISGILGGIIGKSIESRNKLLQGWKDLGGREALINSLRNAFNGILSIVAPIKEAFTEMFPAITAKNLVDLVKGLESLTAKLKINEETAIKIWRIFKGVAAVFDLVFTGVSELAKGLFNLFKSVAPSGNSILDFFANIGDALLRFRNNVKFNNLLGKSFEKIKKDLEPVIKILSDVGKGFEKFVGLILKVINLFDAIKNHGFNSMNTLLNLVDIFGAGIIPVFLNANKVFSNFSDTISKISKAFKKAFDSKNLNFKDLGGGLEKAASRVEEGLSPLGKFLTGAWNLLKKLGPLFSKAGEAIGTALGGITGTIAEAFRTMDFSKIFDAINSGLIIAVLLGIKKFISKGSGAFDGLTGILGDVKGILDGVRGSMEAWQKNLQAKTLMTIATAIGILTLSIIALSLIDSGKLTVALTAITAMFADLVGSMTLLDKMSGGGKKMATAGAQMILMSIAILILSSAVANLARLDQKQLMQGLTGITALMAGLIAFTKIMSKTSGKMTKGLGGLVLLAVSLKLLVGVVEKLGTMDLAKLQQGLAGVGAMLAELGVFMKIASKASMGIGKGAGLILLAVSINILAKAISTLGNMSWEQIGKGLTALAGALIAITAALKFMPKNTFSIGLGLVVVSTALLIMSKAISSMGNMSWEEIAKGMAALGGSMAIIAVGLKFMKKSLPGAAALVIVAAALAIFTPALKTLGSMSLSEIGTGLLALAGIFAILGVAGLVLGPLAPIILTLSAAVLLFGLGTMAVGAGLLLFAAGLTALGVSSTAGAAAITLFVTTILALIPAVILALVNGIVQFAVLIAQSAPTLVNALVETVRAMIAGVVTLIPEIVSAALTLVTTLLQEVAAKAPDFIQAGMDIIVAVLEGIANNIGKITEKAVEIVVNFLDAIGKKLPDIIQAGWDLIFNLVQGLTNGVQENMPRLLTEVGKLAAAILKGLVDGIIGGGKAVVDAIIQLAKQALGWFGSLIGANSPSTEFAKLGGYIPQGVAKGIQKYTGSVIDATKDLGKKALSGFAEATSEITDAMNNGFDVNPTIRPVVDLTDIISGGKQINQLLGQNLNISGSINRLPNMAPGSTNAPTQINPPSQTIVFQQTNNSPKSLSAIEIYRQTKNQLSLLKGLANR